MNTERGYEELLDEAYQLPNGHAKLELLEEAARIADSLGEVDAGYEIRGEIVETATFSGYPRKALVAFSWQLGQYDKNPEEYYDYPLLWSYKWIVDNLLCFPEIERAQIDNLLEDMRRRYQEHGYNDRTYWYYRFTLALQSGELDEAGQFLQQLRPMERDGMSDCEACEQNEFVEYYMRLGDDEQLLDAAQPILAKKMTCAEIPHLTISKVLLPLHRQGRQQEADKYQKQGYRLIKDNHDFLRCVGEQIGYLTVTDPFKGLELFEKHISWTAEHEDPLDNMLFHGYAAALFRRLAEEQVNFNVKLPSFYPYPEHATDVSRLAAQYSEMALETARKLDKRNHNQYYVTYIQALPR
ncbi:hypothetical protein [Paenibacillus bovis]|uniref:DUF4034 domain-containing protein n=1 Tax=Paenibacillus bovis TaxID=1616788 RepID=A0A172ZG47_9BACL|nr:hypothetical protein [Paenibacillus bovis]ANF96120.1 hypothetical protein AR543_08995 [Paenibacillus bovis]